MAEETNFFDLRDVLADAVPETTEVEVWLDKAGAAELEALEIQLADEEDEKVAQKLLDTYREKLVEYQNKRFVFHLESIPREQKQDLQIQAFELVPSKRDAFGREDVVQDYKRNLKLKTLVFHAYITKIVNPAGAVQIKPDLETIAHFTGRAPESAMKRLDEAINKLDSEADLNRFAQQDPDFLSKP